MCGIAGWMSSMALQNPDGVLRGMNAAQAHRGPDGEGCDIRSVLGNRFQLALGHRRLAIIDCDKRADQPMVSDCKRFSVVFNGEIYNYIELKKELRQLGYQFHTKSDTEVLLAAYAEWGLKAVDRFRGMFAFALWDGRKNRLVLARDPFGKKPLYLFRNDDTVVFASEMRALLAHPQVPARPDQAAIQEYLIMRYVPAPATLLADVTKLLPGHVAVFDGKTFSQERYYTPPDKSPCKIIFTDPHECESAFRRTFQKSVEIRMRSDAPFGAFLSGGLDSSAIVATMARLSGQPVRTFSIGFDEDTHCELAYARKIADRFATDHHELVVTSDEISEQLETLVGHRGAPVSEPSDIPIYLLSKFASRHVKMVLTGEGADEFLGGYPKHKIEPHLGHYHNLMPDIIHDRIISPLARRLPFGARRIKTLIASAGERDFRRRMKLWFGAMSHGQCRAMITADKADLTASSFPFSADRDQSNLRRALFFDQTSWLPDNLLERGDRMMMAASIEGRMPFMDRDLAALTARIPQSQLLSRLTGKVVLRNIMRNELPPEILQRRKVGFRIPVSEWFRTSLRDYVHDILLASRGPMTDYLNLSRVESMLSEHVTGRQNHEKAIWTLLNLALFHRVYLSGRTH